jgi:hypothetical protein
LEYTIPLYKPDVGLLFGNEANGHVGHSSLSGSWSAVLPEEPHIPAEDERITFSMILLYSADDSLARTIMFIHSSGEFAQHSYGSNFWVLTSHVPR